MRGGEAPYGPRTIHWIGDLHVGAEGAGMTPEARMDVLVNDLLSGDLPQVAARVQVGDGTDNAAAHEDAALAAFFARLRDGGAPVDRMLPGNHDLMVTETGSLRTTSNWEAAVGHPAVAPPWVLDLEFCRIVGIGQSDHASNNWTLCATADDLEYLDSAIVGTKQPVVICSHAPLFDTVLGPTTGEGAQFTTTEDLFWLHTPDVNGDCLDAPIRDVIGKHDTVVAWVAGHTHSDIDAPGFFKQMTIGRSSVMHVSTSAIFYVGRVIRPDAPIRSVYLTIHEDALELRVRDHGNACWVGIAGQDQVFRVPR